jgi:hypothetical protein
MNAATDMTGFRRGRQKQREPPSFLARRAVRSSEGFWVTNYLLRVQSSTNRLY